jgi:methyl-accepting chemotaxis protein
MFLTRLNNGNSISGVFKRIGKGFKTIWVKATYFPVIGLDGKPFKVVEYAIDVTEHVILRQELASTVRQIQEVVIAVKDGNLTQRIPLKGKAGEIARLCDDVNSLVERMTAVISVICNAGASIMTVANKVKVANDALSKSWENNVFNTKDKTFGTE